MQSLGTWFSGEIDSVRLMVGLNDLDGLLQPKRFYDSVLNYSDQLQKLTEQFLSSLAFTNT